MLPRIKAKITNSARQLLQFGSSTGTDISSTAEQEPSNPPIVNINVDGQDSAGDEFRATFHKPNSTNNVIEILNSCNITLAHNSRGNQVADDTIENIPLEDDELVINAWINNSTDLLAYEKALTCLERQQANSLPAAQDSNNLALVIGSAGSVLLLALLIYCFNRGKRVATKNQDASLSQLGVHAKCSDVSGYMDTAQAILDEVSVNTNVTQPKNLSQYRTPFMPELKRQETNDYLKAQGRIGRSSTKTLAESLGETLFGCCRKTPTSQLITNSGYSNIGSGDDEKKQQAQEMTSVHNNNNNDDNNDPPSAVKSISFH